MKVFLCAILSGLATFITLTVSQQDQLQESISRGQEIYSDFCVTCHMPNGEGVKHTFPPLAKSDYLKNNREASIRGIKYGQQGEITVNGIIYNGKMAPMGLDDEEIADVMNFINNSWGNSNKNIVTTEEVAAIKK
ncbi:c-type cytochrome [Jejuia pallidilutea]|jgi:mono/diheme cytochrome c family protein|uniref:Copper-containing nitrite reductase n=2 Tax=Jejuia pallidilutea TaxID=504487 RepID=A0A090W745_9FLAO|nr:cytochrome c [Jejuia pallidilutea]GAL71274.1 copper-containing nitrite reductase [Jejuia pallidilutea]GAL88745.1 copper-containing nitrite reductase [Jejuia pallidilutea]